MNHRTIKLSNQKKVSSRLSPRVLDHTLAKKNNYDFNATKNNYQEKEKC